MPFVPVISSVLYESVLEAQHWILYDSNKMRLACGDAIHTENYKATLPKGDYVIKLQVRCDDDLYSSFYLCTLLLRFVTTTLRFWRSYKISCSHWSAH